MSVRYGNGLFGALRCQSSKGRNRQNPNSWVTWLAHRTVSGGAPDCPVRPSTAAFPNSWFGGWGYKYPQPPPFKASKFSAICIQYKSSRLHSKTQNKRSNPLQVSNSFQSLVTCERERHLCSFEFLLLGSLFFFLYSCSQATCNQSKRHQVVVVLVRV
jgi:hypothetical protein